VDKLAYHSILWKWRRQRQSKVSIPAIATVRHGGRSFPLIGGLDESQMTILSIGEVLWDVFRDSERLGGAPFNFAVHTHRLSHRVIFLSAVGDDERGREAVRRAAAFGLSPEFQQVTPQRPTGSVNVDLDLQGRPDHTIHRPAAYDCVRLSGAQLRRLVEEQPAWIYYGTLLSMEPGAKETLLTLLAALPNARRFYGVNLRRRGYTPELVRELRALADAVKMNEQEAGEFPDLRAAPALAITRGDRGCEARIGTDRAECPGRAVQVAGTVGADDAFAAAFLHGLARGQNGGYRKSAGRTDRVQVWGSARMEAAGVGPVSATLELGEEW
jgi:fructokinase